MQIRVYYEDTDAGGIVYHTNYIKYCERARSQMFYDEGRTLGENDCHFVVKRIEADYFKPAFLGDIIDVKIEVLEIKGASANILHTIYRGDDKLFSAKILIALVKNGKPIRMPESEVEFFKKKILN